MRIAVALDHEKLGVLAFGEQPLLDDTLDSARVELDVRMTLRHVSHGIGQNRVCPSGCFGKLLTIRID